MMRSKFDEQLAQLNARDDRNGRPVRGGHRPGRPGPDGGRRGAGRQGSHRLDSEIDQKEREIENLCLKLLLQQQPVARDLRQISAALKMITDMERIGDQAEDIAEIVAFLDGRQRGKRRPFEGNGEGGHTTW